LYDYPETDKHAAFNLQMRVNFVDGSGGGGLLRLVGTDGSKSDYEKWYNAKYPKPKPEMVQPETEFKAPEGYNADLDHHANFYKGIREKAVIKEDALFSMRAAGPALASNKSVFEKKIIQWDPEIAKVVNV
jgi:hypothetical protein